MENKEQITTMPNIPVDFLLNKFQHSDGDIYMCGDETLTNCIDSTKVHCMVNEEDAATYKKIICFEVFRYYGEELNKFFITIYHKLAVGSEIVIVTRPTILFGSEYKELRTQWLENGAIREVYDLGGGWINQPGVALVVVVLQKQERKKSFFSSTPQNREVRFVDLATYAKTNSLTNQQMCDLLCKPNLKIYEESVSVTCTNEDLLEDKTFHLSPSRKLEQAIWKKEPNAVKLSDLVLADICPSDSPAKRNTYLDLTTEFIAQNINSSFEVDLSTCSIRKSAKPQPVQFVDCDAVIVHSSSRKQKPFIYRHNGNEPIALTQSWVVLRLRENSDTTLDYLVTEMSMDYFYDQVRAMDSRSIITRLSRSEWLQLYIVLPPTKEEQEARLRENRNKMLTGIMEEQSAMLKDLFKFEKEKYIQAVRTRKHNMKNALAASRDTINELSKVVDSDAQLANYMVFEPMNETLKDYIDSLKANINRLSSIEKHLMDDELNKDIQLEVVNVVDLINKWVEEKRPLGNNYKVKVENEQKFKNVEVEISTHFTEVLDNIFGNAIKHGFTDAARQDYVIRITYELTDKGDLSIKIANNGKGLAPGMTEKTVFDFGQTSGNGEGIGCWHMQEIVRQLRGTISLHNNPTEMEGFTIEFEIILPIN